MSAGGLWHADHVCVNGTRDAGALIRQEPEHEQREWAFATVPAGPGAGPCADHYVFLADNESEYQSVSAVG